MTHQHTPPAPALASAWQPPGLLEQLSGERARWGSQLGSLASGLAALPRGALLAAGAVVHLAGQPEDMRARLAAEWAG